MNTHYAIIHTAGAGLGSEVTYVKDYSEASWIPDPECNPVNIITSPQHIR